MSTAHRPTWNPAHGGDSQSGNRFLAPRTAFSSKDLPRHLTVKQRQPGSGPQSASELKRQLEERENTARDGKPLQPRPPAEQLLDFSALEASADGGALLDPLDADEQPASSARGVTALSHGGGGSGIGAQFENEDEDADFEFAPSVPANEQYGGAAVEEEEEESDEEDETEELMRELERIKKERALEAMRIAAESDEAAAAERTEQILHGNPLVQPPASVAGPAAGSFNVKRRWDDDVVFRNQARKPEKNEPIFINDTLRTEFHKRFLKKYIK
mmetsp:Transcript_19618/g.49076  ORF Transcript_19618/g.49076 Transcript_19618/m.49076 type:complete len:273 (+) Transcript_19618:35-853(+)